MSPIRVSIVGASGYGAAELLRRLLPDPDVQILKLISKDDVGKPLSAVHLSLGDMADGHVIEEHEYIPGRVIIFPGDIFHRGLAPTVPYVYRYTTAYRVVMDQDKVLSYIRTYDKN